MDINTTNKALKHLQKLTVIYGVYYLKALLMHASTYLLLILEC